MLSGISLTSDISIAPAVFDGGFITFNSGSLLQNDAHLFLSDSDSFLPATVAHASLSRESAITFSQQFDFSGLPASVYDVPSYPRPDRRDVLTSEDTSSVTPPTPTFVLDRSGVSIGDDVFVDDDNVIVDDSVVNGTGADIRPSDRVADTPGLAGNTARMLIIDDPVQLVASGLNASRQDQREGGALGVAVAIAHTQRAYESQLTAVVADKLERGDALPLPTPPRVQPVVVELARAVVFETVGQPEADGSHAADPPADGQLAEPPNSAPTALVRLAANQREAAVGRHSAAVAEDGEVSTRALTRPRSDANVPADLAERVEDENTAAHATVLARWPMLAAVIAGYLWVEHRDPPAAQAVQTPPRRKPQSPVT